jgi:hypothetical protein
MLLFFLLFFCFFFFAATFSNSLEELDSTAQAMCFTSCITVQRAKTAPARRHTASPAKTCIGTSKAMPPPTAMRSTASPQNVSIVICMACSRTSKKARDKHKINNGPTKTKSGITRSALGAVAPSADLAMPLLADFFLVPGARGRL